MSYNYKDLGLSNTREMFRKANEEGYAVPAFNFNNMEQVMAIVEACAEMGSPVILQCSKGAMEYMGSYMVPMLAKAAVDYARLAGSDIPVALHLDHGSYEGAKAALDAGFSSIMFDGSHYGIEENIEKTKEIVELCHSKGVSVEAEVGSIGGEEDGVIGKGEVADPKECKSIADLGVDFLAAGIGNIHGKYPANWEGLDFDALDAIQAETGKLPLVLHGGSGIPDEMIKKAITLGVSKVNVNTECQLYFQEATRKYIEAGKDLEGKGYDPRKLLAPGAEAIKQCVKDRMEVFGCIGKA